jgi:hypothetical protein
MAPRSKASSSTTPDPAATSDAPVTGDNTLADQVGAQSDVSTSNAGPDTPVGPVVGQPQVGPDDLQAQPVDGSVPRVATIVGNRQYASGEGFEAGNTAPTDLYLDRTSNQVVTEAPERGKVLAVQGEIVQPAMAAVIAYHQAQTAG